MSKVRRRKVLSMRFSEFICCPGATMRWTLEYQEMRGCEHSAGEFGPGPSVRKDIV